MDFAPLIMWWLIISLFGLAGWPAAFHLFRHLPDRGYSLARPVGFLLIGYILWLGGSFRLLQNSSGGIITALLVVSGGVFLWQKRQPAGAGLTWLTWLKQEWRYVVMVELLFHGALFGWTMFKAYNPNIETAGGEKWMEIAFINGTLRSDYFPPQDPWLSGFGISYYYFGYVMLAMATRLSGIISTVAFNLFIPTLFGMTLIAAFGLVANLVCLHRRQLSSGAGQVSLASPVTLASGFTAALFVAILGNQEGLLEVLHKGGLFSDQFWRWLDIRNLKEPRLGPGEGWIPDRFIWWWRGSRVLTDYTLAGQEQEVIDEFPFFSFLLGDVHPHVIALPFVLLALALALNLVLNPAKPAAEPATSPADLLGKARHLLRSAWHDLLTATGGLAPLLVVAIALGGLSFLNTWDFPIYLAIVGLSLMLWLSDHNRDLNAALSGGVIATVMLGLLGILLYLPFYATFQSQAGGILPNLWNPTRFPQFFVFFGPFLLAVPAFLLRLSGRYEGWQKQLGPALLTSLGGPVAAIALVLGGLLLAPAGRAYLQGILSNPEVQQVLGEVSLTTLLQQALWRRWLASWTFLFLGGLVGWVIALLLGERQGRPPAQPRPAFTIENFVLILFLVGLSLPLAVEFVYLRDNFGIRMNTVFKFYFQAWVLLALASAFAVYYVSVQGWGWPVRLWQGGMLLLVAGGLVYPVLATADKANYFQGEPTLDGMQWIATYQPGDYEAITWLRRHASHDDAVVLEAPGARYAAYQYTGRVSALTGLPTLLGWGGHQSQWRGSYDEPARREPDIDLLFNSLDLGQMQALLDKYDITYVYVGPLERERYAPAGLKKFELTLPVVYENGDVTIYQRE